MLAGIERTWATHCLEVKMRAVMVRKADICTSSLMPLNSLCAHGAQTYLSQIEGEEKAKELRRGIFTISITQEVCTCSHQSETSNRSPLDLSSRSESEYERCRKSPNEGTVPKEIKHKQCWHCTVVQLSTSCHRGHNGLHFSYVNTQNLKDYVRIDLQL